MRQHMGRVSKCIKNQVGKNESLRLHELEILGEELAQLCAQWAPNFSWSVDVGPNNKAGAFLMLGKGWSIAKGGNQGDNSFVWFGIESDLGPFFVGSVNAPALW